MFKLYKRASLILTLCIHVVSAKTFNVALGQPTNLLNSQIPYTDSSYTTQFPSSKPAYGNDGIVTYWEQSINSIQYLNLLTAGQTQFIDFGSIKTVCSIFICMRDQINLAKNWKDQGIDTQIFAGNDLTGGPTSSLNTLCVTLTGYVYLNNVISQWISCPSIQGQYLWISVPNTTVWFSFSEIMVYEFSFVQQNYLKIASSSLNSSPNSQGNLYLPVKQQSFVLPFVTTTFNYQFLTQTDEIPWYNIHLKASIEIECISVIPLLTELTPPSSELYSNNINVKIIMCDSSDSLCTIVGSCSEIIDSNTNPESDCQGLKGNVVLIFRTTKSQLGMNSVGILANCDCSKTSFLSQNIFQSYYISDNLITSNENYFTNYLKGTKIQIPLLDISTLTDTISLVCGDGSGKTYCGNKEIVIWDNNRNQVHTLTGSTIFSLSGNNLIIQTSDAKFLGLNIFTLYVQLVDYPSQGYFPQSSTFTVEVLDHSQMYNILLLTPTLLFNPSIPYSNVNSIIFSSPSVSNDGCVTFFEILALTNWPQYLNVLSLNQQQQFDMGKSKTVYSVFIALRDQINISNPSNNDLGALIYIGNDSTSFSSSSNSLCGTITGNPNARSQWISCQKGINGQYLWLVSSSLYTELSEITAYQYYFVQVNGTLTVQASSNQGQIILPFLQSNPVVAYNSVTISTTSILNTNNYCYLSLSEAKPTITIQLRAYLNIFALVFIPQIQNLDPPYSALYSNNVSVSVFANESQSWLNCSTITNSNYNPESNCYGILANQIQIQRDCQLNYCMLGVCQIGILSDCNCFKTSFAKSMMNSIFYTEITTLIQSDTTNFEVQLNDIPITLQLNKISQLTDTVSLVCGDALGTTFCGERIFAIWNFDTKSEINLSNSTLFSLSLLNSTGQQNLIIYTTSLADVGLYNLALKIRLANYSEAGYFPFYTSFTLRVYCTPTNIAPITPQINFYYLIGSGTQLFNVSNYTQSPSQCFYKLISIQANLISQTPSAPELFNISNQTLQFQLNLNNQNLIGLVATYIVTAQLETIKNYDSMFNIYFTGLIFTSDPSLSSEIRTPPVIPQLNKNGTFAWKFSFPQVIYQNESDISINLNCPTTLQIFKRTINNNTLSLTLDTLSSNFKNLISGQYKCKFEVSNGVKSHIYNVVFTVQSITNNSTFNGTQTNNSVSKQDFIAPIPTIVKISNRGIIFIKWNVEMQSLPSQFMNVVINQTTQLNRVLRNSNFINNPLSVQIQAGSIYSNQSNLQIDGYSIISCSRRDLQIQLYFNDQGYVSAISKDSIVISFNHDYFYSIDNITIQSNFSTAKKILPRQLTPTMLTVNMGQTSQGLLYSMAVTAVLGSPPFQYFANQILSIIEPLTVITHYILINLKYPANIQDFFSQIFPLIQFDLFQTGQLYQVIFNLDQINDGPIDDQFNQVGYSNILAVNNIGSLLLFIVFQPILLLFLLLMRYLLKDSKSLVAKHLKNFFNSKLESLIWNGYITFYFSAYLVLSMIGWISINDLRFGSDFTPTENFSSILGVILAAFSILYPILIAVIYKRGFKPYGTFNIDVLFKGNQVEGMKKFIDKYESIENYHKLTQTYEERKQFIRKQGGLLKDLRTDQLSIGINQTIVFPIMTMFTQLLIVIAVLALIQIQSLSILLVMQIEVIQICYLVSVKPYSESINHYKDLFNLLTKLFLTYLLIMFTDFVAQKISDSGGNQFLYVVLVNVGVNLIIAMIVPLQQTLKYMKKYWKRFRAALSRYQEQQRLKQLKLKKEIEQTKLQERRLVQMRVQIQSFMQIDEQPRLNLQQSRLDPSIKLKSKKSHKSSFKTHQTQPAPQQKQKRFDIQVPQMMDIIIQNQPSQLLINKSEPNYPQLYFGEQNVRQETFDFVQQQYRELFDQIEKTIEAKDIYDEEEQKENTQILIRNVKAQEAITLELSKNKVYQQEKIGMTDISKWQRHWDSAFEPTSDNTIQNIKEAETYKSYLKTRKIVQLWDKPPKFNDENLTLECQIAYQQRIQELNQEIIFGYEDGIQRRQLRQQVAEKLCNQPEIVDDNSRSELVEEISQFLIKKKF